MKKSILYSMLLFCIGCENDKCIKTSKLVGIWFQEPIDQQKLEAGNGRFETLEKARVQLNDDGTYEFETNYSANFDLPNLNLYNQSIRGASSGSGTWKVECFKFR